MDRAARTERADTTTLVRATRRHVAAFRDGFNSGTAASTTRWYLPRSFGAIAESPNTYRRFAIVFDGRTVGTCSLWAPTFAGAELAIAIFDKRMRGRGVGTRAMQLACDVAFNELKVHRVELGVYPGNDAAIHVYKKCGFRRDAMLRRFIYHNGAWRDLLWMSLLRNEWAKM